MDVTLKRSMKLLGALLITLSSITPASCIFIVVPSVIQQAGTGAFYSFIAGGVISLLTAFVYAELSSAWPLTGGEYTIVGRVLGPFCGFIILGINIASLILAAAILALGIADYTTSIFGEGQTMPIALISVAVTTLLAILNIRLNAFVTGLFLLLEMGALIGLTALGFLHPARPFGDLLLNPQHLSVTGMLEPVSLGIVGFTTSIAIFAYNGYGNAVYLGEETHDAPRNVAHAILWSMLIVLLAEAVPVAAILIGAPDLKTLFSSSNMLPSFIRTLGGEKLQTLISLSIALAIFNANLAFFILTARQLYSTGRDKVWPRAVNRGLTRIHKKFHSPWVATLACGILVALCCFIPMNFLLILTSTSIIVTYMSLCIAVIVARRKKMMKHGHYRMPWHPWPAVISFIALAYIIYTNYLDPDVGRPSLVATLGMIAVSIAYYLLVLRRRGNWELHDPQSPS
jgi:amino acid transporter